MTKISFFAAVLLLAAPLPAEPVAIFSRTDSRVVADAAPTPTDKSQAAFFADYGRDRAHQTPYALTLPIVSPPIWGRTVGPQTGGNVSYHARFARGLVCRIELHDLLPNHSYLLTLNGNPEKAGNALLPTPVPGNEREKYYDFLDIKTDTQGRYDGELGIWLKRGEYDVRLYVKDSVDFKIVLYRDFFKFTVE